MGRFCGNLKKSDNQKLICERLLLWVPMCIPEQNCQTREQVSKNNYGHVYSRPNISKFLSLRTHQTAGFYKVRKSRDLETQKFVKSSVRSKNIPANVIFFFKRVRLQRIRNWSVKLFVGFWGHFRLLVAETQLLFLSYPGRPIHNFRATMTVARMFRTA